MPIPDPNKIIPKLEEAGVKQVRKNISMGLYAGHKIPVIKNCLQEKESNTPTYMYHAIKAPKGKIFKASEVPILELNGWVDSPDPQTLFKGIRGKWYKFIILYQKFKSWAVKNPNASIPLIVMAFIAIVGIGVTLFIHFTPNTTSQTKAETNAHKNDN